MKEVLLLISNVDDIVAQYPQVFDYHEGDKYKILLTDYSSVEIKTGNGIKLYCRGKEVNIPDAFYIKTGNNDAFILENLLLQAGAESVINMDEVRVARSKIITYNRLAANGIRVPETYVFFNHPDEDILREKFSYPFVIKPDNGFGGEGVKLIHNDKELSDYLDSLEYGVAYVAQEYISTSKGKDVRVVMYNSEVLFSIMRSSTNPDEFRSNVHVGGEILDYPIDDDTVKLCKKIAGLFDLPVIGIDLMIGNGEFVVAEINSSPGITGGKDAVIMNEIIQKFFENKEK